jgi:hypothetical protein
LTGFAKGHVVPQNLSLFSVLDNGSQRRVGWPFKADNTLTKLVKEKKLKRTSIVGGQGNQYSVA